VATPGRQTRLPIRWRSHDVTGTVTIELLQEGNSTPVLAVASGTPNNGQFPWTIPNSLSAAVNYLIRVTRDDLPTLVDQSDAPFAIVAPVSVYFVNDAIADPGDWTSSPGDDSNDGLTPPPPKPRYRACSNPTN